MRIKDCPVCGSKFVNYVKAQVCCSHECAVILRKRKGWFYKSPEFKSKGKGSLSRHYRDKRIHCTPMAKTSEA